MGMPLPRVALTLTRHSTGCSNCSRILASEQYTWEPDFSRSSTAEPATHLEAYGNHSRFVLLQFSGRLFPICLAACFTPERDITAAASLSRLGPPPTGKREACSAVCLCLRGRVPSWDGPASRIRTSRPTRRVPRPTASSSRSWSTGPGVAPATASPSAASAAITPPSTFFLCDALTSRALSQPTRGSEPGTCLATKLRCCLSGPRRPSYS